MLGTLSHWFWKECYKKGPGHWKEGLWGHPHLQAFQERIAYSFKGPTFLLTSLSHKSFINELSSPWDSYERLEFLGDSFVNYLITRELFRRPPGLSEGQYSKMRGSLVNTEIFSQFSHFLGVPSVALLGRGNLSQEAPLLKKIYADIFEAVIGGILLERGEDKAARVVLVWLKKIEEEMGPLWGLDRLEAFDYKSRLQEEVMKRYRTIPEYKSQSLGRGKFLIVCRVRGKKVAQLTHSSKRQGQKQLAQKILQEGLLSRVN